MQIEDEKVIEALKTVFDPEIPVDVYELGLIYYSYRNWLYSYAHFFDKHDKKMVDTLVAIQGGQKGDFF